MVFFEKGYQLLYSSTGQTAAMLCDLEDGVALGPCHGFHGTPMNWLWSFCLADEHLQAVFTFKNTGAYKSSCCCSWYRYEIICISQTNKCRLHRKPGQKKQRFVSCLLKWRLKTREYRTAVKRVIVAHTKYTTAVNELTIPARLLMLFLPSDSILRLSVNEAYTRTQLTSNTRLM